MSKYWTKRALKKTADEEAEREQLEEEIMDLYFPWLKGKGALSEQDRFWDEERFETLSDRYRTAERELVDIYLELKKMKGKEFEGRWQKKAGYQQFLQDWK